MTFLCYKINTMEHKLCYVRNWFQMYLNSFLISLSVGLIVKKTSYQYTFYSKFVSQPCNVGYYFLISE